MLLLVPQKIHEVPQPKRLHHVCGVGQELLLVRQGRVLLVVEERGPAGRPHGRRQLPHVPQQDRRGGSLRRPLVFSLLRPTSGQCHVRTCS